MRTILCAVILCGLLISIALTTFTSPAKASSSDYISFDSGITVYSPLNMTYSNTNLVLNVSLYSAGYLGSIDPQISLKYSIDGAYNGSVPLRSNGEFHVATTAIGATDLPSIPEGPHTLTFDYYGLNQRADAPKYMSYVNTIYFSTVDQSVVPSPTLSSEITPSATPTSTPVIPELSLGLLPLLLSIVTIVLISRQHKPPNSLKLRSHKKCKQTQR
ncbi:MAG: hypothetical protein ACFCUE_09950 [Candidatus Bathyarchaeia archaeon]|jgi:hypothetical protein